MAVDKYVWPNNQAKKKKKQSSVNYQQDQKKKHVSDSGAHYLLHQLACLAVCCGFSLQLPAALFPEPRPAAAAMANMQRTDGC
jgi:hypothetical protein